MFFNKIKKLADQAITDVTQLSATPPTSSAEIDGMYNKRDSARGELDNIKDKADSISGKALLLWCTVGLANIFISAPLISIPLFFVTIGAAGVAGYQAIKGRVARHTIERLSDGTGPTLKAARESYNQYNLAEIQAKAQAAADARKAAAAAKREADARIAEGFNVSASDLDLDKDMTVRRIRLKPQAPATVA